MRTADLGSAAREVTLRGWAVFHDEDVADGDTAAMNTIARACGRPSARDGGPLWPVAPRAATGTFSVTSAATGLHTDAQYHERPESRFLLFCVRPAECGGGLSRLLRTADLLDGLSETGLDENDTALLERGLWRWRTPEVFRPAARAPSGAHPVIGRRGRLRWRYDNLVTTENGLAGTARRFHRHIEDHPATETVSLSAGDVLYCDNSLVLHGRTAFRDPGRLLYRTRLW
ncbi:TauD/TfdA family dioxygenase [Streptomyces sp. NPDC002018]|uniref:TauD/TfdA family dioxygenase n=1 Tax=Streptomyces sp. NPDC002018 TaxID=3364629 RepID=UPI0036BB1FB6